MKFAVIGAGSWGTALANMLGEKHEHVVLWARNREFVAHLRAVKENTSYLPGVPLRDNLTFTDDLEHAVAKAKLIILATPSHAVRATAKAISSFISPDSIVVSAAKGLELGSLKRMSEVIAEEVPQIGSKVVALSGPNHAEEVGRKHPSATVVACSVRKVAEEVQDLLILPYFRVYTNPDIIGVELGGALKNIIALGAGIADGLGFGDNTKAALMTRGLAEIARLGMAMNANPLTFAGLAGIGDLMVTCTSKHSRNRSAGTLLAQGKTMEEVQNETRMVVEGIKSTRAAYELAAQHKIEMPITEQTFKVLYEKKSPREAVLHLMTRGRTHEVEEVALDSNW